MELERNFYQKLISWKNESNGSKALMIEGVRRVGKSTIARKFAKENYKSYILVDFNNVSKKIKDNFENLNNLDFFFQTLSLEYNTKLYKRESVIIFDEIQKFPRAREAIKYLVNDGRYDFVETGSLISIKENVENITIPSEERTLKMYPLTFEEFVLAKGESLLLEYIKECYEKKQPLEQEMHAKAMHIFREYMLVGGMPQSVVAYLDNNLDFEKSDIEKRDILELYRNDIKKAAKKYSSKVSALFENIPAYLSTHEKKIVLSEIENGATFSKYDEPLFWLDDSMICNLCYKCNDPCVGFALNKNDAAVKCYLADTGLFVSLAFSENEIASEQLYRSIMNGKLSLNEGMIYENAISQIIASKGHKLYFYTHYNEEKHRNDIEIDFLLSNESKINFKIFPMEVKSAKNYTTTSLNSFKEKYSSKIEKSFIVHPKNFSVDNENGIIKIPPYMLFCVM